MLSSLYTVPTLVAILALTTLATASHSLNLNQQPLLQPPTTLHTIASTSTSYAFLLATQTRTRYIDDDGSTAVPRPVQTWYAGQKERGCDRTACASCWVWYGCRGGEW